MYGPAFFVCKTIAEFQKVHYGIIVPCKNTSECLSALNLKIIEFSTFRFISCTLRSNRITRYRYNYYGSLRRPPYFFFRFSFLIFCLSLFVFDLSPFVFDLSPFTFLFWSSTLKRHTWKMTNEIILKMYHQSLKTKDERFLNQNQRKKGVAVLGFHKLLSCHWFCILEKGLIYHVTISRI